MADTELALRWREQVMEALESVESRLTDLKAAPLSELTDHLDSLARAIDYTQGQMPCEDGVRTFSEGVTDDHSDCHDECYSPDYVVLTDGHDSYDRAQARLISFEELADFLTRLKNQSLEDFTESINDTIDEATSNTLRIWNMAE